MKKRCIPVLITCDIDPTPEVAIEDKRIALRQTHMIFEEFDIAATFFVVANVAESYDGEIERLAACGHEIGCHGMTHDESEEYTTLFENEQHRCLTRATAILEKVTGQPIRSFRGPRVKTSHITQGILEDLGYLADTSVCSQRIDFISSNLINMKWIFAPRMPYHPDVKNAFKRGRRKLMVVPVSALGLPFISGSLYVFGLEFMKRFFKLLYCESRKTGKPIVYLMHPAEFAPETRRVHYRTSVKDIKARGFYFRRKLKLNRSADERMHLTHAFLSYIREFPDVEFMRIDGYVDRIT